MDVASMRRVDRWLGVPLCASLTLVRRLSDLVKRSRPGPPRRIVFVKLAEQGATVLAYGALCRATEMVGRENVFFLVFSENRFILDVMQVLPEENVITIRATGALRVLVDALRAVWRMRKERVDSAVDFEFFARSSAVLAFLSGAQRRVGFHSFGGEASYRGDLMTHRLSFNPFLHATQVFLMEVEALALPPDKFPALDLDPPSADQPLPEFRPSVGEEAQVARRLQDALGCETLPPLILLNANCSDLLPLRRWPTERYVQLSRRLLRKYPEIGIAFTGAPAEAEAVQRMVDEIGSNRCVNVAGRTALRELLVLYCLAEVLVTNDSGPAHFATLTPIDIVTLFGPETPAVFGARTPQNHVLYSGVVCSPCVNAYNDRRSSCTDNVCMQRISVVKVFERVCSVYEKRRDRVGRH